MRLGVIARCDDRGLGNQGLEVCRNLDPERILLVDTGPDNRFTKHPERYDQWDTTTVRWMPGFVLDESTCRRWLDGLDVVYVPETPYDDRLPDWANDVGCRVVVHANQEQLTPERAARLNVTWWSATPWRLEHLPPSTRIVPMPAPTADVHDSPATHVRFVHTAGWPTVGDRNGTEIVIQAAQRMTVPCTVTIRGQNLRRMRVRGTPMRATIEHGNLLNYWDLYKNADVLVMPRRYGGLCLPVIEAMAAGLCVVMSDCSPNEIWPGVKVSARSSASVRTPGGNIPMFNVDPTDLAAVMDELAADPDKVHRLQQEARAWAQLNSWPLQRDRWLSELGSSFHGDQVVAIA